MAIIMTTITAMHMRTTDGNPPPPFAGSNGNGETALYDLLSWMSPAWPIGAFTHSGGLEWAVEAGHVIDRQTTQDWLDDLLVHGPLWNDAVVFVHAWRATVAGERDALTGIAHLGVAAQIGRERHLESTAQGAAFRRIALATTAAPAMLAHIADEDLPYPVAAAALFASQGIPLRPALTAFLHGALANLVSAAQRLVPLGQTDGQLVLRALRAPVFSLAQRACALSGDGDPFDAMAGATLVAELGCMAHETQYTRLFQT